MNFIDWLIGVYLHFQHWCAILWWPSILSVKEVGYDKYITKNTLRSGSFVENLFRHLDCTTSNLAIENNFAVSFTVKISTIRKKTNNWGDNSYKAKWLVMQRLFAVTYQISCETKIFLHEIHVEKENKIRINL